MYAGTLKISINTSVYENVYLHFRLGWPYILHTFIIIGCVQLVIWIIYVINIKTE